MAPTVISWCHLASVPSAGIEPAHLSILEFESSASTNSANWADVCFKLVCKYSIIFQLVKTILNYFSI